MELRMRSDVGLRRVASSALIRSFLPLGWLLPLLLLLVVLLLTAFPVASADAVAASPLVGQTSALSADLAASQPQTLSLDALPDVIPANGLATSVLTADVQDALSDPIDDGTVVVFSTTLGTFPAGLTITPQPTGILTIEAESEAVITTGLWVTYSEPAASSGEFIYSNNVSATASCEFTGTAVSVIFQKQSDAGIARVYVDDELYGEIDTFWDGPPPGKLYQQEEVVATGLSYAPHVIKVEVTAGQNVSATDHYLLVDAFRVYGHDRNGAYLTAGGAAEIDLTSATSPGTALVTACAGAVCDSASVFFGQNLPAALTLVASPGTIPANGVSVSTLTADVNAPLGGPAEDGTVVVFTTTLGTFPAGLTVTPSPTGTRTLEAESGDVAKVGTWTEYSQAGASGGKGVYADAVGAKVTAEFTGTAVAVVFQKQFNGGIVHVILDGVLYSEIDTYWDDGSGTGVLYQQEELIAAGLPYGLHQVEVQVTGTKNPSSSGAFAVVDAIRFYGHNRNGAYLTSGGVATAPLTSAAAPGTAQVTACAVSACDSRTVRFRVTGPVSIYLPIAFKYYPLSLPEGCTDLIRNGSFEDDTAWSRGVTPRPPRYTTEQAQTGNRSALLGLKPGEGDLLSYSSVRQSVALPSNTDTATFSFWYLPLSDQDSGDRQECLLLDKDDHLLAVLMRTNADSSSWVKMIYDISAHAGQTVNIYCNAYNDGDGSGVTGFYLDTVSVVACTSGEEPPETPEPPSPPTPEPLPPLGPLDCYPGQLSTVGVGNTPHDIGVNSAARRVYVANHGSNTLSVVSSSSYSVLASPAVGQAPNGVAYNPANDRIYVANGGGNSVAVLRASDYGLVNTIAVGSRPNGVAVNKVTNRVYVANSGSNSVSIINGATNIVQKTVAVGPEPIRIAIDPILNKAFVSLHGTDQVAIINGAGNVTHASTYSAGAYGIAVDALRHLVYVATIDTYRIAVVDGTAESFLGWAEIRRMPSAEPVPLRMIEVNPLIGSSGHIFVTTAGEDGGWNRFLMLAKGWPEHFNRPTALDLNEPREGIAFEPTTLRVYATSRSDNKLAVYLDGQPSCPETFAGPGDYQITVCVAKPDGTCQQMIRH